MAGDGWMTARKSNAQIARDKKRASQARGRKQAAQKGGGKKKKVKEETDYEASDDDDDLDSFIVDDDHIEEEEEEEADWSEGDEEEEDEELEEDELDDESSDGGASVAAKKRTAKKQPPVFEILTSSDDDDDDGFPTSSKPSKRQSKPAPHLLGGAKKKAAAAPRRRTDSWGDDVDILTSPEVNRPMAAAKAKNKKRPSPNSDNNNSTAGQKLAKMKKSVTPSSDDDDDDSELFQDPFAKASQKPAAKRAISKDTISKPAKTSPYFLTTQPSKVQEKKRNVLDDDENDEDMQIAIALSASIAEGNVDSQGSSSSATGNSTNSKPSKKRVITDDEPADDYEVAFNLAIEESLKETTDSKPSHSNKHAKNPFSKFAASASGVEDEEQAEMEHQGEEEEEPEDEDDNYGETEIDRDALEARSILETAKRLSGQILQTLTSWGGSGGMIVQGGAVAFTGGETDHSDTKHSSDWISNETMVKACPDVKLAPYQLIGVNWLVLLHKMTVEVNGKLTSVNGVLADEMGLGKTCQTIAFLALLKSGLLTRGSAAPQKSSDDDDLVDSDDDTVVSVEDTPMDNLPHLIVVPASVLSNWENEFKKFAPDLNVVKFHGSIADRIEAKAYLEEFRSKRKRHGESLDVILVPTTYFQKENSDDRSFLRKFRYNYMIIDEAHQLKNHQGQRYKTLDKFRTNHRLLLSGTPVMNNPQELMSLLCFLMPLFSRKSHGFAGAEETNDGGSRMLQHFVALDRQGTDDAAAYRKLKELFAPFVLRRRKQDVLSQIMPPKTRNVEFVDLDPIGRKVYNGVLEKHVKSKGRGGREHVFTQLRKAAHHPLLLRTRYLEETESNHLAECFLRFGAFRGEACRLEKVKEEVAKFNDFDIHLIAKELLDQNPRRGPELDRYVLNQDDLFSSSKCQRLRVLLPELVAKGHRVLVFSVWTTCLDLLSCLLEVLDMKYLRMEGSTAVSERQSLIDEFNCDASIPIFLLSTKACGLGINLTAADVCIMHDIDFNPFNDLQAEDRCHRIGQKKPVQVIKLVAKDTVDQDIHSMQERKASMSAAIMESSSSTFESKKERDNVFKTAVDRYLASPHGRKEKENLGNAIETASM